MPLPTFKIQPVGNIDRRGPVDGGNPQDVLARVNFYVAGVGNGKYLKKIPGSTRVNSSAVDGTFNFIYRYYTGQTAKTFAYSSSGDLYYVAPDGSTTSVLSSLNIENIPCAETMRVSSRDVMYFSDGEDGIYSYDGNAGNTFTKEGSIDINPVIMISHLDRMWYVEEDSDILYFSANLDPLDITDSTDAGYVQIGAKRGSKIQNVVILNETLYIFKDDSIWVLIGRTPSEFEIREVHPSRGVIARHSVVQVETAVMFLGNDYEVYEFGGTFDSVKLMTYNVALSGEGGEYTKDINAIINKNMVENVRACYHNRMYRMALTETGRVTNNLEYVYNATNQTEHFTDGNNVSAYCPFTKYPDQNELMTGRADTGLLMWQYRGLDWDDGQTGATMQMKLQTKFVRPGGLTNVRFKKAWLNVSKTLQAEPISTRIYLDGINVRSKSTTFELPVRGEYTTTSFMNFHEKDVVTSRGIIPYARAKGLSISYEIDSTKSRQDLAFSSIETSLVVKERKRKEYVGV